LRGHLPHAPVDRLSNSLPHTSYVKGISIKDVSKMVTFVYVKAIIVFGK
jgi:hypothetical protein